MLYSIPKAAAYIRICIMPFGIVIVMSDYLLQQPRRNGKFQG